MIDFSQVYQRLDDTVSFFENEEESVIAQVLTKRIQNRTLNGLDVNMTPFIPYTPTYAKYGRYAKGLSTSPVDLYVTGAMLNSIYHNLADHTLWINAEFIPIAEGNQSRRIWFAVNDEDWQAAQDAVVLHYNERR